MANFILRRRISSLAIFFAVALAVSTGVSRAGDAPELERLKHALQSPTDQERINALNNLKIGGAESAKLAEILIPLLADKNGEVQNRAAAALIKIGPPAAPGLVGVLKSDAGRQQWPAAVGILMGIEAKSKQQLPDWISVLAARLGDKDVQVRIVSCDLLQRVAPRCKDSIPALIGLVSDPEGHLRNLATNVLLGIGGDAVPALKDQLKNPRPEKRVAAIQGLIRFDKYRAEYSPALLPLLKDEDVSVRVAAINALHPMRTPEYFDPIVAGLSDPNVTIRQTVVNYLQQTGKDAKPALKEVVKALRDNDGHVRAQSQNVLRNIGADSLPALVVAITGDNPQAQIAALEVAQSIGKLPEEVVPLLLKQSLGENSHLRNLAINALAKHIPETLPRFKELLASKNPQDRLVALAALQAAGLTAAPALPDVMVAVKDPDANIQNTAASTLMHLGPTAIPELVKLLKDGAMRDVAARILDNMSGDLNSLIDPLVAGGRAGEPIPVRALRRCGPLGQLALAELTKEQNLEIRVTALETLAQMGATHPTIVAEMTKLLKDPHPKVRGAAYRLYARKPHFDATTAATMIEALNDSSWEARRAASEVLRRHAPVPALIDAIKNNPNPIAREEVVLVLDSLGTRAKPAIKPMFDMLRSDPSDVRLRKRVFSALVKIEPKPGPLFLGLLDDADSAIRVEAMHALKREDVDAGRAALVKLLADNSAEVRSTAAKTLAEFGSGVVRDVEPLLVSQQPEVRGAALQAIAQHQRPGELVKYAGDNNIAARDAVTWAWAKHKSDAFPSLEEALFSKNFRAERTAAQSLLLMEERPDDLVPVLVKALLAKETEEPEVIARAILGVNPEYGARLLEASALTPVIVGLAKSDVAEIQELACMALAQKKAKAAEAKDELTALVKNPATSANVLAAAARALNAAANSDKIDPDLVNRIVHGMHEKSMLLREMAMVEFLETENRLDSLDAILMALALDQSTLEASEWALLHANAGNSTGILSPTAARILAKCNGGNKRFPGRLTPQAQQALKAHFWRFLRDGADNNKRGIEARPFPSVKAHLPIENLVWMTSAYIALEVLKDDPDYRSDTIQGQTLKEHHREWSQWWREWVKARAQFGLWSEPSLENNQVTAWACLLNMHDCASDAALKQDFKMLLDLMAIEHEQTSSQGNRVGGYNRKSTVGSLVDSLTSLLLGQRCRASSTSAPNLAVFCTTSYRMPATAVLLRMLGRPISPDAVTTRRLGGETIFAHAGANYVLGCQFPQPHGNAETFGRWLRLSFDDGNAVFFPHAEGDRHNVQYKNVYFSTCGGPERPALELTANLKLVERDNWLFIDNGPGYAAIYVTDGFRLEKSDEKLRGRHAVNLLYSKNPQAALLLLAGDAQNHGDFDAFQTAVLKAPLKATPQSLAFTAPNLPAIEYFRDGRPPLIGGVPTPRRNDGKAFEGPHLQSDDAEGVVTARFGALSTIYDFRNNRTTEKSR